VEKIFPHNEHSYSPVFPLHLYFYCDLPSPTGGETPFGDTRLILPRIDAEVRDAFVRKGGVLYVRNYGDGMACPGRPCSRPRTAPRSRPAPRSAWSRRKSGNRLRTRQKGPAMVRHPRTGETVWFNHATFFNALTLPDGIRDSLRAEFADDELPQNTFYGDGSPIPEDHIRHLQQIYRDVMVEFPGRKATGDPRQHPHHPRAQRLHRPAKDPHGHGHSLKSSEVALGQGVQA
jgi:hypothetical protein